MHLSTLKNATAAAGALLFKSTLNFPLDLRKLRRIERYKNNVVETHTVTSDSVLLTYNNLE